MVPTPQQAQAQNPAQNQNQNQAQAGTDKERILVLEGIVFGSRVSLESTLAGYLIELKGSPLFDDPHINTKSMGFFNGREVLRFEAQLNLS